MAMINNAQMIGILIQVKFNSAFFGPQDLFSLDSSVYKHFYL